MKNTEKIRFSLDDHQKQWNRDKTAVNSYIKDCIHKVRPPGFLTFTDGREAARFSGSCQVLLRKRKEKKMPQLNWSTLLKHSICQTAKVTCIAVNGDLLSVFCAQLIFSRTMSSRVITEGCASPILPMEMNRPASVLVSLFIVKVKLYSFVSSSRVKPLPPYQE